MMPRLKLATVKEWPEAAELDAVALDVVRALRRAVRGRSWWWWLWWWWWCCSRSLSRSFSRFLSLPPPLAECWCAESSMRSVRSIGTVGSLGSVQVDACAAVAACCAGKRPGEPSIWIDPARRDTTAGGHQQRQQRIVDLGTLCGGTDSTKVRGRLSSWKYTVIKVPGRQPLASHVTCSPGISARACWAFAGQ
jgi:hypothetical protein